MVTVRLQWEKARLFGNTGCQNTLIPPEMYNRKMGNLVQAKRTLKATAVSGPNKANMDTTSKELKLINI